MISIKPAKILSLNVTLLPATTHSIDIEETKIEMDALNRQLKAIGNKTSKLTSPNTKAVEKLSREIENTKLNLRSLKEMITENPEKALSLPLIKKDIEQLKEENKALKNELDRVFDFNKWFIGIIVTILLALIASTYVRNKS